MTVVDSDRLAEIAAVEFADVVVDAYVSRLNELRIMLIDGTFVDVWFSLKLEGRYSFHWERLAIDGTIYRYDNAPHQRWESVATFPHHFHDGSEAKVVESHLSHAPETALREFLSFVRDRLTQSEKH